MFYKKYYLNTNYHKYKMTNIHFVIGGRLGNAIFRYLACCIMCITFGGVYNESHSNNSINCNDKLFNEIKDKLLQNEKIDNFSFHSINMDCYYQHDMIYRKYKNDIQKFIINNPTHYVLTDGINAGDCRYEKYFMTDILKTPENFEKKHKNVLHLRLEDFVTHNMYISKERIIELLEKNILKDDTLCIVCKKPDTKFENEYISFIVSFLKNKNILVSVEHNDTLTDYYIMKEAELLICSKSTLSWCSAFFSDKIKKCYMPEYNICEIRTCKYPIEDTGFY